MDETLETYRIGKIRVKITETETPNQLMVECNDGTYRSGFTVKRYEYLHYKRHMNQKIKDAYKAEYERENDERE